MKQRWLSLAFPSRFPSPHPSAAAIAAAAPVAALATTIATTIATSVATSVATIVATTVAIALASTSNSGHAAATAATATLATLTLAIRHRRHRPAIAIRRDGSVSTSALAAIASRVSFSLPSVALAAALRCMPLPRRSAHAGCAERARDPAGRRHHRRQCRHHRHHRLHRRVATITINRVLCKLWRAGSHALTGDDRRTRRAAAWSCACLVRESRLGVGDSARAVAIATDELNTKSALVGLLTV